MAEDFKMSEKVTLEFYTRTLNGGLYTGTLCVYLFDRNDSKSPPDTMLTNMNGDTAYWTYTPAGNATGRRTTGKGSA